MMNCELRQLNTFIKSCSTSNAAIKNTASPIPKEGWYPAYSASGQDVWLPEYRYSGKGIVVSAVGARCGKCFQADGKWNVTANTHVLLVDESIADYKYCWYLLNNENWWIKSGSGQPFVKVKDSLNRSILLPDLSTQQHIATILDKISEGIALCRKMMDELDLMVKAKFGEMFGDPIINPMHYSVHQLAEYIRFLTSGSRGWAKYYSDEGEWFITIKNVKNCNISVDDVQCITPPQNAEANRTRLKEGDLLISITADLGRTGVVTKEIAEHGAYNNQHLTCIRLDQNALVPLYVAYFMESSAGKAQFEAKNMSAVKAGLNFDAIRSLKLIVPPLEQQNQFALFVAQIKKFQLTIRGILDKMEMEKLALMQEYFGREV